MDRQIPRSIQYSDLRPEVIENQVKLIRFTPQTNIQNQVPNDVVRFQLIGNGFLDPYSTYIHMIVDFGKESDNFTPYNTDAPTKGSLKLRKYWDNVKQQSQQGVKNGWHNSHISFEDVDQEVGCRLGVGILSFDNIVQTTKKDGSINTQAVYINPGQKIQLISQFGGSNDAASYLGSMEEAQELLALVGNRTMPNINIRDIEFDKNFVFKNFGITDYYTYSNTISGVDGTYPPVRLQLLDDAGDTHKSVPIPGAEFKMLDRSAHSFINRLVIRSQGTEIERIEQYDVVAAMLNDLIYSNEQAQFHSFEGFGGSPYIQNEKYSSYVQLNRTTMAHSTQGPRGRVGERIWGWAFAAIDEAECDYSHHAEHTFDLTNSSSLKSNVGLEVISDTVSAISRTLPSPTHYIDSLINAFAPGLNGQLGIQQLGTEMIPNTLFFNRQEILIATPTDVQININQADFIVGSNTARNLGRFRKNVFENIFFRNQYHPLAQFVNKYSADKYSDVLSMTLIDAFADCNVNFFRAGNYRMIPLGQQIYEFVIPIYSGLIGVLMPEKKLIPMSLMPLEVDFTLNPHALITAHSSGYGNKLTRLYTMRKMEVYSHVVFFEQEVHRSMESIVAEHGLFIHMNTFYMAPVTLHATDDVTNNIAINLHFKNINSIHMVNMYTKYLTTATVRKLHFCSHNLRSFQIRNGSDLIPSEPLNIQASTSAVEVRDSIQSGRMSRIFIELLKSYNKMHDPLCDTALDMGLCYQQDNYADTSSRQADDYDVKGTKMFQNNTHVGDVYIRRAFAIASRTIGQEGKDQNQLCIDNYDLSDAHIRDITSFKKLDYQQARGFLRAARASGFALIGTSIGVSARGAWGVNPNHISIRPNIFFIPTGNDISGGDVEIYGLSARLLSDKISRFSAMVGRCQYAISLEGINLGSNAQLLCGKRGMIPFDIMVQGTKSDKESSMSLVFAKCDFIVYIRPDLVVTVLGR